MYDHPAKRCSVYMKPVAVKVEGVYEVCMKPMAMKWRTEGRREYTEHRNWMDLKEVRIMLKLRIGGVQYVAITF